MEGERKVEDGCAVGELAGGQSHSSGAAGRDAMGVAGIGLTEGLRAKAGRYRSAVHADLVGAGQGRCMGEEEEHWSWKDEEARCWELTVAAGEMVAAFGFGLEFLLFSCSRSSARPGDL